MVCSWKSISWKRCCLVTASYLVHVYFTNQESYMLTSAKMKKWKIWFFLFFFVNSTYLWKRIFIPRYDMIIFIYKSLSVNSGRLTLFIRSEVEWGFSFDKSKVFRKYIFGFKEKTEVFNSFFPDKSVLLSPLTLLTENSSSNCHFLEEEHFANNQEP